MRKENDFFESQLESISDTSMEDGLETVVSETSQLRDRAEFELRELRDEANSSKQELEFAVQEKTETNWADEVDILWSHQWGWSWKISVMMMMHAMHLSRI